MRLRLCLLALLPQEETSPPTPAPTKQAQDAFTGFVIPGNIVQEAMECNSVADVTAKIDKSVCSHLELELPYHTTLSRLTHIFAIRTQVHRKWRYKVGFKVKM